MAAEIGSEITPVFFDAPNGDLQARAAPVEGQLMPMGWRRPAAGLRVGVAIVLIAGVVARARGASAAGAATDPDAFDDPKLAREPAPFAPSAPAAKAPEPTVAPGPVPTPAPPKVAPPASAPVQALSPSPPAPLPAPPPPPKLATPAPGPVAVPASGVAPPPPVSASPVDRPAAPSPQPQPLPAAPPRPSPAASGYPSADLSVKAPPPAEPAPTGAWPYAPRLKLSYRRFSFSRMPATGTSSTAAPVPESFESFGLDFYPMSWYLRVGFSSQFGLESGQFQRTGDYFLAELASAGFQIPGRFTPFAEAFAGAGYMRRFQNGATSPSAYWQTGVDAGVEIYFAKRAYGSVALGYLHPGNLFLQQKNLSSVNADTWSLKVGIGI